MTMQSTNNTAPELAVTRWFNTPDNPTLADFRGEVVVIETFQMLCPGCVSHGLPQAKRIQQNFGDDVTLLGLHTVFEHHDAMTPVSLEAFLHEYQITFPVGVDAHAPGAATPITMGRYRLRGTPSLVVIDRAGSIRLMRVWPYRRPRRRRRPRPPYRRTPPPAGGRPRPQDLINCPATGIQPLVSDGFARPA